MPRKARGSGFTHKKSGRFHRDSGGAGRGFIAGRPKSPQLPVGEIRSPSPGASGSEETLETSLDSVVSAPSPIPSSRDSCCSENNDTHEFLEALAESDSESAIEVQRECGPQSASLTLIDQTLSLIKAVLPKHWIVIANSNGFNIVKLSHGDEPAIQRNVYITHSGAVRITVHRKPVSSDLYESCIGDWKDSVTLTSVSQKLYVDKTLAIVLKVRGYEVCGGSDNATFSDLWSSDGSGFIDENPYAESRYVRTFRSHSCPVLIPVEFWRCTDCKKANERLRERFKTHCKEEVHRNTRNDYLDDKQTNKKLKQQMKEIKNSRRKVDYLKKVRLELETEGVTIDSDLGEHLTEVLRDSELTPMQHVFLQQQLHFTSLKDKRGMRWHPAMIRFALLLRSVAGIGGYDAIKQSGVIKLPGERTLFDYTNAVPRQEGVFTEKLDYLQETVSKLPEEHQKFQCLLVDEIHISQKLVYRKCDGKLVGYMKLTEVEEELKLLEEKVNGPLSNQPTVATCILAFMLKGVTNSIKELVAAFPVACLKKEQLYERTWEVISACEIRELEILALISDGCSVNRAFIGMHTAATVSDLHTKRHPDLVFDTVNLCAPDRLIYFIADPPHLLKTIRNCLAKSGQGKKCTRLLTKEGQFMVWKTIERLYVEEVNNTFRKCHKLTAENVYLNSYTCMNVAYAGQVMSRTVGLALKEKCWANTESLAHFILSVNDFFDNLNGAHSTMGKRTGNRRLDPYTSVDDCRFEELRSFEKELLAWEAEVESSKVPDNQKSKMLLSRQTLEGIYITINGFIGVVKFMLSVGAKFINARSFCQDPLEQYFSKQRSAVGAKNNPTVSSFMSADAKITITRDLNVRRKATNIEGVSKMMEASEEPLPKRKKSK